MEKSINNQLDPLLPVRFYPYSLQESCIRYIVDKLNAYCDRHIETTVVDTKKSSGLLQKVKNAGKGLANGSSSLLKKGLKKSKDSSRDHNGIETATQTQGGVETRRSLACLLPPALRTAILKATDNPRYLLLDQLIDGDTTELDLSESLTNGMITAKEAEDLVQRCRNLYSLNLSGVTFTGYRFLSDFTELTKLNLNSCKIKDTELKKLVNSCTLLRELDLMYTGISDEGLKHILPSTTAQGCPHLQMLDITGNYDVSLQLKIKILTTLKHMENFICEDLLQLLIWLEPDKIKALAIQKLTIAISRNRMTEKATQCITNLSVLRELNIAASYMASTVSFCSIISSVLRVRGNQLTSLIIPASGEQSVLMVDDIARYCPELVSLSIDATGEVVIDDNFGDNYNSNDTEFLARSTEDHPLQKLNSLTTNWVDGRSLLLLLSAPNLKMLEFQNASSKALHSMKKLFTNKSTPTALCTLEHFTVKNARSGGINRDFIVGLLTRSTNMKRIDIGAALRFNIEEKMNTLRMISEEGLGKELLLSADTRYVQPAFDHDLFFSTSRIDIDLRHFTVVD